MLKHRRWLLVPLLALGLLAAACGDSDGGGGGTTDASLTEEVGDAGATTDDSTAATPADDGTGTTLSPECDAINQAEVNDEAVALFPEELQDDAQAYVDAYNDYLANGDESTPGPEPSAELSAYLDSCLPSTGSTVAE